MKIPRLAACWETPLGSAMQVAQAKNFENASEVLMGIIIER